MELVTISVLLATVVLAGPSPGKIYNETTTMPVPTVAAIIERYGDSLMALDDVVGIAESLCNDRPCLKVLLHRDNLSTRTQLPGILDGVPVVIEISGPFQANP